MKSVKLLLFLFVFVFGSLNALAQKSRCNQPSFHEKNNLSNLFYDQEYTFINSTTLTSPRKLSYTWWINGNIVSRDSNLVYKTKETELKMYLTALDSVKNCIDTTYRSYFVFSPTTCKMSMNVKDTIDRCHKRFWFLNFSSDVDSFELDYGDGQTFTHTGSTAPSGVIHQYKTNGIFYPTLTSYGIDGLCKSIYLDTLLVKGCDEMTQCQASFQLPNEWVYYDEKEYDFVNNSSGYDSLSDPIFKWYLDDELKSTSKNYSHRFVELDETELCLVLEDTINKCIDTFCKIIKVLPSTRCKMQFTLKDTLDSCSFVFILKNYSSDVDSFTVRMRGMDSFRFTTTHPKRIVYSISRIHSSFYYNPQLVTYGNSGFCVATYDTTIKQVKCGNKNYCSNSINGSAYLDSIERLDSIKYGMYRDPIFSNYSVWLIKKNRNKLSVVDSIVKDSTMNSQFNFTSLCPDTFYVKAALLPSSKNYKYMMPTYYGGALRWQDAEPIVLAENEFKIKNYSDPEMIPGVNPGGSGFIAGDVRKGANKRGGGSINGVQVMVLNEEGKPVAYTYSNIDGSFKIENLGLGKYHVVAEVVGLETEGIDVTLDEENPNLEGVRVEVGKKKVTASIHNPQEQFINNPISLYPNPALSYVMVKVENEKGQIRILDISGREVKNKMIYKEATISLSELEKGTYIFSFTSNQGHRFFKRLVVQ